MLTKIKLIYLHIKQYFLKLACFLVTKRAYYFTFVYMVPILLSMYLSHWREQNDRTEILKRGIALNKINFIKIATEYTANNRISSGVIAVLIVALTVTLIVVSKFLYPKPTVPNKLNKAKLENLDKINILRDYEILKNKIENSKIITKKNKNYL